MVESLERDSAARDWLLIDCAHKGEVRLMRVSPGPAPVLGVEFRYEATVPTFTDVLLKYARDSHCELLGLTPVVAIAGVPGERSMVVERSNWVISREGLASVFGIAPIILNEVASQAWALRASLNGVQLIYGDKLPDMAAPGRYAFITYEEGVGSAILDIDREGQCTVLDAEGGQLDFLPLDDEERSLANSISRSLNAAVSWEQVLMHRANATSKSVSLDHNRLSARLLGRFGSNLIYASGAWNGVFITGSLMPPMSVLNTELSLGLLTRRPYARLLTKTVVCRVNQNNAVLTGCATMMATKLSAMSNQSSRDI